jgi:hypothetical protein
VFGRAHLPPTEHGTSQEQHRDAQLSDTIDVVVKLRPIQQTSDLIHNPPPFPDALQIRMKRYAWREAAPLIIYAY